MSVLAVRLLLASIFVCALAVVVGKIRNNKVIIAQPLSGTVGSLSLFFIDLEDRWGFDSGLQLGRYDQEWSSDARYVAYSEENQLTLLNIFTHERRQIETELNCLSWSPDDRKLFCQPLPAVSSWVVDRETLSLREVFSNYRIRQFVWAPDSRGGIFTVENNELTTVYIAPTFADPPQPIFSHPGRFGIQLSPDRRYLVAHNPYSGDSHFASLIDLNNGSVRSLNDDFSVKNEQVTQFAWSPDSTQLAFQGERDPCRCAYPLYVLDINTGNVTLLAEDGDSPWWLPNGLYVTFYRNDEEDFGTYSNFIGKYFLANADGSEVVQVAQTTAGGGVRWLDDSEHFVFYEEGRLYRRSRTGRELETLFFETDEMTVAYMNEVNLWE